MNEKNPLTQRPFEGRFSNLSSLRQVRSTSTSTQTSPQLELVKSEPEKPRRSPVTKQVTEEPPREIDEELMFFFF